MGVTMSNKSVESSQEPMPLVEQMTDFRQRFPDFESTRLKEDQVSWVGRVTPSPSMTATYKIKVEYELGNSPKVFVLDPELESRNGSRIPHRYRDGSLCLYLPSSNEWIPSKPIAQTIVPWACLWLYYYEVWHATGKWKGGGIHPIPPPELDQYDSNPLI